MVQIDESGFGVQPAIARLQLLHIPPTTGSGCPNTDDPTLTDYWTQRRSLLGSSCTRREIP
jgi:hypothetical protein